MPEYLAPGVYVEERPGQRAIEGVATSTAGFVGMTERGPVEGPPVLVTSLGEFQRVFGGFIPIVAETDFGEHGHLPLAIKQYFDNGGKRAFIARAYKYQSGTKEDDHRKLQLTTGVTALLRANAPKGASSVFATSTRGFGTSATRIRKDKDDTTGFAVTAAWGETKKIALAAALTEPLRADTAFVTLRAPASPADNVKLVAREPGKWGEDAWIAVQHFTSPAVNVTSVNAAGADVEVMATSTSGFYEGCAVVIAHTPKTGATAGQVLDATYTTLKKITGNKLTLEKPAGFPAAFSTTADQVWISLAEVEILASWRAQSERFRGTWRYMDRASPPAGMTAHDVDLFNANHSVWMKLHAGSTLVRLGTNDAVPAASLVPVYGVADPLASHPATATGFPTALVADGVPAATPDKTPGIPEYNGDPSAGPGTRSGIFALTDEESIALVAVPGITSPDVQLSLLTHCETLKYRFAVLDGPPDATIAAIRQHRHAFDSKYAAVYYPWITVADPTTGDHLNVPPSGTVLGIYGRSDGDRGVHKAPANEITSNAVDVVTRVSFGEQEVLNPEGVNVIRDFRPQNRGIRVWGARTVSSDPEWKYVNVRRLFIFLEHSIDNGTQWVVFEPNNQDLWRRVRRTIETFLIAQWRPGALFGDKPEQAFYVRCDRSTMSEDDIANGRLIVEIGIAPTKPAEFVIFRLGQFTADANQN